MRKARHIDIFARLEATKRLGLVEDYRIDWQPSALSAPRVTVWGRSSSPVTVTRNYVATLLDSLVPTRAIVVRRDTTPLS